MDYVEVKLHKLVTLLLHHVILFLIISKKYYEIV